jgi:uncharacterized protein YbjT (DUF2867 family)
MRRILVTGALGNVGRETVRACLEQGLVVRAAGRDAASVGARFPGAEACALDFLDRATWAPALRGCEAVFLLRPPPLGDMKATLCPFVDAARAEGAEHVVFLSVAGAERMTWVPHHAVEVHLASRPGAHTILRPGFFAQNVEDAYRADVIEDGRVYVPAGRGRVAFIDVRDVGDVAARVLAAPDAYRGRALVLTGPAAIDLHEAAATLSAAIGRPVRYEPASIPGYAWHLRRRRHLAWTQIAVQTVLHVGLRRGDAEGVTTDVPDVLGRPARSFAEYAKNLTLPTPP